MDRETYERVAEVARNIQLPGDEYARIPFEHPNASDRWAIRWRSAIKQLAAEGVIVLGVNGLGKYAYMLAKLPSAGLEGGALGA